MPQRHRAGRARGRSARGRAPRWSAASRRRRRYSFVTMPHRGAVPARRCFAMPKNRSCDRRIALSSRRRVSRWPPNRLSGIASPAEGTRRRENRRIPRVVTLTDQTSQAAATAPLLEVRDLHVQFETSRGTVRAVDGISYTVNRGEIVAIVGESGCGKSVSSLAIMRLLAKTGRVTQGSILFDGRDLLDALRRGDARDPRPRHLDDLPGADDLAQSGPLDRRADDGAAAHPSEDERRAGAAPARSSCCSSSASPTARAGSSNIRIISPAACASA